MHSSDAHILHTRRGSVVELLQRWEMLTLGEHMEKATTDTSPAPHPPLEQTVARARAEFYEMPGLCLTRDQARRLWALDRRVCDATLELLVATRFLRLTGSGSFILNRD